MAEIDSSIYFQQQPLDIMGSIQKGMSLSQMAKDAKLRDQQIAEQEGLKNAYAQGIKQGPDGKQYLDREATLSALAQVNPMKAYEQQKQFEAEDFQKQKTNIESNLQKLDLGNRLLSNVSDQESFDQAMETGRKFGIDTSAFGKYYDPNLVKRYQAMGMSAKERLENEFKKMDYGLKQEDRLLKQKDLEIKERDLGLKRLAKSEKENEMSVSQAKQKGLYDLGVLAEAQYKAAVSDPKQYNPTNPGQWIDNSQWAPNWAKNDRALEAQTAQKNWVEAFLRDASGAAIPPSERMAYAQDFFPQPGDTPAVIANKAALRKQKMENARFASGSKSPEQEKTKEWGGSVYKLIGDEWVKQ